MKMWPFALVVLLSVTAMSLVATPVVYATDVRGNQSGTWTRANSPYAEGETSPAPEVVSVKLGGRALQEGVKNAPFAAGLQTLEVVFNTPGIVYKTEGGEIDFKGAELRSFPDIEEERIKSMSASADGSGFTATIDLPANATYQLWIGINPDMPRESYSYYFGTVALPDASVSGIITPPASFAGAQWLWSSVGLLSKSPPGLASEDDVLHDAVRGVLTVDSLGFHPRYELRYVPDGTYYAHAWGEANVAGRTVFLTGFYDANGDGTPDPVKITGGGSLTGIDVALKEESASTVRLSETELGFGFTTVGSTSQRMLTVTNSGSANLTISGITVTGTNAPEFRVSPTAGAVAPGQSLTLKVTFAPLLSGSKTGELNIAHNAAGSPTVVRLSGTGSAQVPGGIRVVSVKLGGKELQEGAKNAPFAAGLQTLEIVFNGPGIVYKHEGGEVDFRGAELRSFPDIEEERIKSMSASADGSGFTATIDLPADATYQLWIGINPDMPREGYSYYFGTVALPDATVSGIITPPASFAGAQWLWSSVGLLSKSPLGLASEDDYMRVMVRAALTVDSLGFHPRYELRYVPDGTYYVQAWGHASVAADTVFLTGFYDANGDGKPDSVRVSGGKSLAGMDFTFRVEGEGPLTPKAGDGSGVLDLKTDAGDQNARTLGGVKPGQKVDVQALFNQEVVNSTGFSVVLKFDPTKVSVVGWKKDGTAFASAIDLPAQVKGDSVTYGASILGGTTTASGGLAVLTFQASDSFSGETEITLATLSVKVSGGSRNFRPGASVVLSSEGSGGKPTPDFSGDGEVGFDDFFLFAAAFGQPATGENAKFDLDADGEVGFGDFFVFAAEFGKKM